MDNDLSFLFLQILYRLWMLVFRSYPSWTFFTSTWNVGSLTEVIRLMESTLPTPSSSWFCCCWGGALSLPHLRLWYPCPIQQPPKGQRLPAFRPLLGVLPRYFPNTSTSPVFGRARPRFFRRVRLLPPSLFSKIRPHWGLLSSSWAVVPQIDCNMSKFTKPTSPQQDELDLNFTAHYTKLAKTTYTSIKSYNQFLRAISYQFYPWMDMVTSERRRVPPRLHVQIFAVVKKDAILLL